MVCLIIVSTPGPGLTKTCLNEAYIAFKKFVLGEVVGWGGGWSV